MTTYRDYRAKVAAAHRAYAERNAPPVDLARPRVRRLASPDDILTAVCEIVNVPMAEVFSSRRHKEITFARRLYSGACKAFTTCSYPDIARVMGRKSHATNLTCHQVFLTMPDHEAWLDKVREWLANRGITTTEHWGEPQVTGALAGKFLRAMSEGSH